MTDSLNDQLQLPSGDTRAAYGLSSLMGTVKPFLVPMQMTSKQRSYRLL